MSEFERGDLVRFKSKAAYKQPYRVGCVYSNGKLKLVDKFGAPVVSVSANRVEPVGGDE